MIKRITYVAPHKAALTIALVFTLTSLLFVIPMAISFSFMPSLDHNGNPINRTPFFAMMIAMPIMYFIFGYIFTGFGAWIYNKVSKFTGGIPYESNE